MKVRELYNQTVTRLRQADIPDGAIEAELLLRFQLDLDRVGLFMADQELDNEKLASFELLLSRRLSREPLSYITGEKEFWSLSFEVSPAVLIPRPETELLIEITLSLIELPSQFKGRILDLGTGSGIIPIVLSRELPGAELVSIDLSPEALRLAARNLKKHGVADRVSLLNGNWFEPLASGEIFDLIVSNPPYVADRVRGDLQPELDFEPGMALYAGEDGMQAYRSLIPNCREYMRRGGYAIFEIGADQSAKIEAAFNDSPGLELVEIVKDLSGLSRVAVAKAVDWEATRR
jgi:release factor glutamine methyltransferase